MRSRGTRNGEMAVEMAACDRGCETARGRTSPWQGGDRLWVGQRMRDHGYRSGSSFGARFLKLLFTRALTRALMARAIGVDSGGRRP